MLLSIITVIRNDLPGLLRTVESLKSAIDEEINWVVVDSSDTPIEKVLRNELREFSYAYTPPAGIYSAMNLGTSLAQGNWIWFLNAGDEIACSTGKLKETLKNYQDSCGVAFSVNILSRRGNKLRVLHPEIKRNEITKKIELHTNHQGFLFKKTCLSLNPYDLKYQFAADTELIDKIANSGIIGINHLSIANFYINGRSAQNYRRVMSELREIRPEEISLKRLITREWFYLKTTLRRFIY